MNKLVAPPSRGSLAHKRIQKLLYSYVNLRLLQNFDDELLNMIEYSLKMETESLVETTAPQA